MAEAVGHTARPLVKARERLSALRPRITSPRASSMTCGHLDRRDTRTPVRVRRNT
jgi:hypothetical protein